MGKYTQKQTPGKSIKFLKFTRNCRVLFLTLIDIFDNINKLMARVIFLQNIRNVAQIGDIKEVADGYARNFLLPRKLAVLANDGNLKMAEQLKQKRVLEAQKEEAMVAELMEKLANDTLTIERTASEEGTLYDGLDAAEISGQLKKERFFIEPEQVNMEAPLKKVGEHQVEIEFGKNKKVALKVEIKKLAE